MQDIALCEIAILEGRDLYPLLLRTLGERIQSANIIFPADTEARGSIITSARTKHNGKYTVATRHNNYSKSFCSVSASLTARASYFHCSAYRVSVTRAHGEREEALRTFSARHWNTWSEWRLYLDRLAQFKVARLESTRPRRTWRAHHAVGWPATSGARIWAADRECALE